MNELTKEQEDYLLEEARYKHSDMNCTDIQECKDCPRYMDDCDGRIKE